jgi:molybdate transport system regulatory protein
MNLKPNGRIWIDSEDGSFIGKGRIELLEKIQQTGSLRKASIEMKMSYQQAWKLITQMNERATEPIVFLKKGGVGGGVTLITPFGESLILTFKEFNSAFQEFLENYKPTL